MKVRTGFVSNSSTTSFVVICERDTNDRAIKNLHPYYQKWVQERLSQNDVAFLGKDVIVSGITVCSEDQEPLEFNGELPPEAETYYGYYEGDDDEEIKFVSDETAVNKYIDAIREFSEDIIVRRDHR